MLYETKYIIMVYAVEGVFNFYLSLSEETIALKELCIITGKQAILKGIGCNGEHTT